MKIINEQKYKTMKKLILSTLAVAILASCSNDALDPVEFGTLSLTVQNDTNIGATLTRADSDYDSYGVKITNSSNSTNYTTTYGALRGTTYTLGAATGYSIEAYNCTEEVSKTANDNYGQARYYGSNTFGITANSNTDVTVACSMSNSKVSTAYTDDFKKAFTANSYSTEFYASDDDTRKLKDSENKAMYFPAGKTINYTITAAFNGTTKTYTGSFTSVAAKNHKLTVGVSTTNGTVGLSITVDKTITDQNESITVNPYQTTAQ
jgi:hypothetical protein